MNNTIFTPLRQGLSAIAIGILSCSAQAEPQTQHTHHHKNHTSHEHNSAPQYRAPIGVMGDHLHPAGGFMFSYRYMDMAMQGNQIGQDNISDETLVSTINNRFSGMPNMPTTLRIAPQKMDMKMHMLGFMYAPNNDVTLMLMLNYLDNRMNLTTFDGMMGTNIKGTFTTKSSGLSDSKIGLLYRLYDDHNHHFHFNLNWHIPTGDIEKADDVLPPMTMTMNNSMTMNNMTTMPTMRMRLPYAMQLGSGSHRLGFGATYNGYGEKNNWGGQIIFAAALADNKHNYQLGDTLTITSWYGHQLTTWLASSMRLTYRHQEDISGIDPLIMGPVQTANPSFYGGQFLDFSFGLNTQIAAQHRLALEYQLPVKHDVNGVQMKVDNSLTLGYQFSF